MNGVLVKITSLSDVQIAFSCDSYTLLVTAGVAALRWGLQEVYRGRRWMQDGC